MTNNRACRPTVLGSVLVLGLWAGLAGHASGGKVPEGFTPFEMRFRIVPTHTAPLSGRERVSMSVAGGGRMQALGSNWSTALVFDYPFASAVAAVFPNSEIGPEYPLITRVRVSPARTNAIMELGIRWLSPDTLPKPGQAPAGAGDSEGPAAMAELARPHDKLLTLDLMGDGFMFMVGPAVNGKPLIQTTAEYNRRYWPAFQASEVPRDQRPRRFPLVDHFSTIDDDRTTWREAVENMARMGITVLGLGHKPIPERRALTVASGLRGTSDGDHAPLGGFFDYKPGTTDAAVKAWAEEKRAAQMQGGFAPTGLILFAVADEPAWAYPKQFKALVDNAGALARFRDYLKAQGLGLADIGAQRWEDVRPMGRSQARDLPSRRLFYWSMRFFAWDSTRHFARSTRALEEAFYPGLPVFANWATHSGRFYIPGGFGNNPDKASPDAAQGCHDWLEFGRMRGCTMLWVEDWFGDSRAWQWSFYCSKLNSAARKGGVQFGGYIIPRTSGTREDGILQRILTIVGSGGKAIRYFTFGPEYNFPVNCYSEKSAQLVPRMAEAHHMIGAAEELLWPGRRPQAQVAFVSPRSALVWDAMDTTNAPIRDAGNSQIDTKTVDYMSEVYCLYLALQHANVPVDWVEEDDLSVTGLAGYRVVYLTEPDLPAENALGLAEWVKAGGTLATVSGAGSGDRYGQPCRVLSDLTGIVEAPRPRLLVEKTRDLPTVATGTGNRGDFAAVGIRGQVTGTGFVVRAAFSNGTPAVIERACGAGRVLHYAWMPGMSYLNSSREARDGLPVAFSESIRAWITEPLALARAEAPVTVSRPMIETPLLLSDKGAAITLLNWTGEKQAKVEMTVRLPFEVRTAEAVKAGELSLKRTDRAVTVALPLGAADIVMLRP